MNRMTHSALIPFPAFNNISISVNKFNVTLVFFKFSCRDNPGALRKRAGSSLKSIDKASEHLVSKCTEVK